MAVERTLSIIKPDATNRNLTGKINAKFEDAGLRIAAQKRVHLTIAQAGVFYAEHAERPFYGELCEFMALAHVARTDFGAAIADIDATIILAASRFNGSAFDAKRSAIARVVAQRMASVGLRPHPALANLVDAVTSPSERSAAPHKTA